MSAATEISSPKIRTRLAPSTIFRPRVPFAWKPTMITLDSFPQVVLQVVLDPSCLAHPAAGENDPAAAQRVEGHRILNAPRYDDPECLGVLLLPLVHLPGLRVEALGV